MRVKLFPIEFDPAIASGPPTLDDLKRGLIWNEKDTEKHRKLALEAKVVECKWLPPGACYIEVD
jgi:hypothetical protein